MSLSGKNISLPIYHKVNGVQTPFHNLVLKKFTVDSVVMSLGDKITGDVYYISSDLEFSMQEYVIFNGIEYTLVNPPTLVKEGLVSDNSDLKGMSKYSLEFYHPMYILGNLPFTDVAVSYDEMRYKSQDKTFSWIGKPADFVAKLNKNLENTEWLVVLSDRFPQDKMDELSEVLSFDKNTIADVLKTGYETWKVPFIIDSINTNEYTDADFYTPTKRFVILFGIPSNEIYKNFPSQQANNPFVFKFGQGIGLKNNSRTPRNNKIVTRIAGYGSENNIPYGYPQIRWYGDPNATCTIGDSVGAKQNVEINGVVYDWAMSYPIYNGIVGGEWVKLIKHPFTRNHLMPTIYANCVFNKVSQFLSDGTANPNYNPDLEIVDYYDAIAGYDYVNLINPLAPSYEIHEFSDIKPELGVARIRDAYPINADLTDADSWDDTMDDDGNYLQSYFKITLPQLTFDIYACAAITQEMQINMRSGACIGCTFTVQVDWEDYKRNFYDSDMNFAPTGSQRDYTRYPDSSQGAITVIVQKDINTFGTLMPNIYQHPRGLEVENGYVLYQGDEFVVLGISLPLSYITTAQERLDEAMKSYMLENNVYYFDYPLKVDEHFLANNIFILNQVRPNCVFRFDFNEEHLELFVKQLTIKFNENTLPQYDITLTDNIEVVLNQIGQVADDVEHLSTLISLLRQQYNRNVWVELAKKLSKVDNDTAQGLISFAQGWETLGFFSNNFIGTGAKVDVDGIGEFEEINIRGALRASELIFNMISAEEGESIRSIGHGEIATVTPISTSSGTATLKLDGDELPEIRQGDICRGLYNTIHKDYTNDNIEETEDQNGFRKKKGFFASYFMVMSDPTKVNGEWTFNYILQTRPLSEHPCPMMKFAVYGNNNPELKERQSSMYITAVGVAPRLLFLAGVNTWKITSQNIKLALGNIDGIKVWEEVTQDEYNNYDGASTDKKTWVDDDSQTHWAVINELKGDAGFYCEDNIYLGGVIQQIKNIALDAISSQISNLGQSWVSVSNDAFVIDCDNSGNVLATTEITVDSWLYFGTNKCTLKTGRTGGMPNCYYSYNNILSTPTFSDSNTQASKTYTFNAGANLVSGVITIFLKGTYDNVEYTASKTVSIIANKQGSTGNGIESITTYYLLTDLSDGVTVEDFGSQTEYTLPTAQYPYLWRYTHYVYTNEDTYDTEPELIATYSEQPNINLLDDTNFNDLDAMDAWTAKGELTNYGSQEPEQNIVEASNGTFKVQFRGNQGSHGEDGYIEYLSQPVHSSSVDKIKPNSWYTLSFWIYGMQIENGATTSKHFYLDLSMSGLWDTSAKRYVDGNESSSSNNTLHFTPTSTWTQHTVTFKTPATLGETIKVRWLMYTMFVTQAIYMKMPKLEIGMVATNYVSGELTSGQPMARAGQWGIGNSYYKGDVGERWIDVVSLNGKWFQCAKSHISNNSNKPTVGQDTTFWKQANNFGFVATELLLAQNAVINLLSSNVINLFNASNVKTASINADGNGEYCIHYPTGGKRMAFSYDGYIHYFAENGAEVWRIGLGGDIEKFVSPRFINFPLCNLDVDGRTGSINQSDTFDLTNTYWQYKSGNSSGLAQYDGKIYNNGSATIAPTNPATATAIPNGRYTPDTQPHQIVDSIESSGYAITVYVIEGGFITQTLELTEL